MKDYKNLKVWEKSHLMTLKVYEITKSYPKEEVYGLISQIRRSAASVPANIAEGCGKGSDMEFGRYLQIALGSLHETEYYIFLSKELGYVSEIIFKEFDEKINETKSMLIALIKKVKVLN